MLFYILSYIGAFLILILGAPIFNWTIKSWELYVCLFCIISYVNFAGRLKMKLENFRLKDRFTVDGLNFNIEDVNFDLDTDTVEFSVHDSGGLEVGRFFVYIDDNNVMDFESHPNHPKTLDRINYRNDTARISKNVKNAINSVRG